VGWSVVKWNEGLRDMVSVIIRSYTEHIKFYWFLRITLVLLCFIVNMVCFVCFCLILYIMYSHCYVYVFLLFCLCILIIMCVPFWVLCFIVLFCVLFVCKCVMYYCHRMSTQLQLSNIYIYLHIYMYISYHIQQI